MSRSFCREYEEFKAYRKAKRQEWVQTEESDGRSDKQCKTLPGRSSGHASDLRQHPRTATGSSVSLGSQGKVPRPVKLSYSDQQGIESFSTPPSSEQEDSGDLHSPLSSGNQRVATTSSEESDFVHHSPPRKKRPSDHVEALRSHLKLPTGPPQRGNKTRSSNRVLPQRKRKRPACTPSFDQYSPADDDIIWSDSQPGSSQDVLSQAHRPVRGKDTGPPNTSSLQARQSKLANVGSHGFLSSWREAFLERSSKADGSDHDSEIVRSGGVSSEAAPNVAAIGDFESDPEDTEVVGGTARKQQLSAAGRSMLAESRHTIPDSDEEGDKPQRKGSAWLASMQRSDRAEEHNATLMNDTMSMALAADIGGGGSGSAPSIWQVGKQHSTYIKGGYAEHLSHVLSKRQRSLSASLKVVWSSGAVAGLAWLCCQLLETNANDPVMSMPDSCTTESDGDLHVDRGVAPRLVVIALPGPVIKGLPIRPGIQIRVLGPWQVARLVNFCPPVFLRVETCEVVSQPEQQEAVPVEQLRMATLASMGICPYHASSCTPCGEEPGTTACQLLNTPSVGVHSSRSVSEASATAASRRGARLEEAAAVPLSHDHQHRYHHSVVNAIEAAGGCGSAVNGGVAVVGRVQLAQCIASWHTSSRKAQGGRSLVASQRSQLLKPPGQRLEEGLKCLLIVQDSLGSCFQVQADLDDLPPGYSEPQQLLGHILLLPGLHLTDRLTVKRHPNMFALLKCFASSTPPALSGSQADSQSDWELSQNCTLGSTFYSFHTAPGPSAQLCVADELSDAACSWCQMKPTCCPNFDCSVIHNKMRFTRWSLFGRVLHTYAKGNTKLLVVAMPSPGGTVSGSERSWTACVASSNSSGRCAGVQPGCYDADGDGLHLIPLCVSIQPPCIVPSVLTSSSKVVLFLENVLLSEEGAVMNSLCAVADTYSSLTVAWPSQQGPHHNTAEEADSTLLKAMTQAPIVYTASETVQPMKFVRVSGKVVGVDESTALSWSVCKLCGADVEESNDGLPSCLYCCQCGTVLDEVSTTAHMQLDVFLEDVCMPPVTTVTMAHRFQIRLQQSSIVELLPPPSDSQNPDVGYDFSLVLGKTLSNLTCFITSLSVDDSGAVLAIATEMPAS